MVFIIIVAILVIIKYRKYKLNSLNNKESDFGQAGCVAKIIVNKLN